MRRPTKSGTIQPKSKQYTSADRSCFEYGYYGPMKSTHNAEGRYNQIYGMVRLIPAGRVASYGQIATLVDCCTARMVGYAMAALSFDSDVPWHRVINSKGEISPRSAGDGEFIQRALLEDEGIVFDDQGRINFSTYRWAGPAKSPDY